jgi:hypothetical protein
MLSVVGGETLQTVRTMGAAHMVVYVLAWVFFMSKCVKPNVSLKLSFSVIATRHKCFTFGSRH